MLRIYILCMLCIAACITPLPCKAVELYEDQEIPSYAKWGLLAVQKTKERYPKADIIDYLHMGRDMTASGTAVERFKLWMRENGREFGLLIAIEFDMRTERVIRITFEETDR